MLPYDRFETDKWDVMDADVRFKGRKIEHGSTLPLSNLSTHIILKNADLRLQPLKFGMAGEPFHRISTEGIKSQCRKGGDPCASAEAERADAGRGVDAEDPR